MKKIFIVSFILAACSTTKQVPAPPSTPSSPDRVLQSLVVDGKLFTSVYQQTVAEYKALCLHAFTLARLQLDQALKTGSSKQLAIITDIDETILDNSRYAIHRALQGKDYETLSWSQWIARSEADTIAGAYAFLTYAASRGVEVFYITNRDEKDRNGTQKNLEIYNFPNADARHLIMRQGSSSKEERRAAINSGFEVVLLLGDNLADFSALFDKTPFEEREVVVRKLQQEFGRRFILIPNPVYGDWESALYGYNNNYSTAQKDSILKAAGKSY